MTSSVLTRRLPSTVMLSTTTVSCAAGGFWARAREGIARSTAPATPKRPVATRSTLIPIRHPAPGPASRRPISSRVRAGQRPEHQLVAFRREVDLELLGPGEVAGQHPLAQGILDVL